MFPVKAVLGFVWFVQLAVAQDYHGVPEGLLGVPVNGGSGIGNILTGTQGFLNRPAFLVDSDETLPGVIAPSGVIGNGLNVPLAGVPAPVLSGVPVVPANPAAQVAAGDNSFQAIPVVSGLSAGLPVFTGQSGQGVFSLPTQQGGAFLDGQGGSFVGSPVFGQTGAVVGGAAGVPVQGGVLGGAAGVPVQGGVQGAGFVFASSILQQQVNPTVTQTVTLDAFETLTDLVLHSAPVTITQFSLITTTRLTRVVVPTPVNDVLALSTSVVFSPTHVTLTETKSDFRVVVRTSVRHETLTHTVYAITHVPFTTTITETVRVTSPLVKTVIVTSVQPVTSHRIVTSTAYVHAGYY